MDRIALWQEILSDPHRRTTSGGELVGFFGMLPDEEGEPLRDILLSQDNQVVEFTCHVLDNAQNFLDVFVAWICSKTVYCLHRD